MKKKDLYNYIIKGKELKKKLHFINKNDFLTINKSFTYHDHILIDREPYQSSGLDELIKKTKDKSTILILDQLTDQINIGNIFRTAALTGVNGIILPEHSSASITSTTATISTGAVEIVKFHIAKNISRTIEILKKNYYWVYSLDMDGKDIINKNFKFDKKSVIIVGSEGKGIRKNIIEHSDFTISLKQENIPQIDSLNAANS
ncbi:RNA methyltransferase, partial [Alphaproteobacteria bacterium]|nr:RNA methyltransferase [Alphaproteobacteria bacterium]